jgi:dihydrofolate reductase
MNAIFAVNAFDGFAVGNTMPWPRNSVDLQRFRRLTAGHTVVMGRGTWDSDMPKPLPKRRNCVLSTTLVDDRCEVFSTVEELVEAVKKDTVWVIGGVKTLWQLQPHINMVYMTQFRSTQHADIFLGTSKYLEQFELIDKEYCGDHTFKTYRRIT